MLKRNARETRVVEATLAQQGVLLGTKVLAITLVRATGVGTERYLAQKNNAGQLPAYQKALSPIILKEQVSVQLRE